MITNTSVAYGAKARAASTRLNRALLSAGPPRCSDPSDRDLWTSEEPLDRALAVTYCNGCPVILQCRDVAESRREPWGVWAAKDYSPQRKHTAAVA